MKINEKEKAKIGGRLARLFNLPISTSKKLYLLDKLTPDQVDEIREELAAGVPQHVIAANRDIHPCHISRIASGKRHTRKVG